MAKRKKISTILLSIAIVSAVIILLLIILPQFLLSHHCKGHCSSVESDANSIAAAIADYFSVPEHTKINPADLIDNGLYCTNPWTLLQCGDVIYIYVYDLKGDCPSGYQDTFPEWDSGIYTKIMD